MHFRTQKSFVDQAPCEIDYWYHTGQMRQLRSDLSSISGCHVGWQQENCSNYTQKFIVEYNDWFSCNESTLEAKLAEDIALYRHHFFS